MADPQIVRVVRAYLQALGTEGVPTSFGVLFGSQARGDTHQWSDIDLVVVSPKLQDLPNRRLVDLLWVTAARTDVRLQPIPCGDRDWVANNLNVTLEIARREGQIIYPDRPAAAE